MKGWKGWALIAGGYICGTVAAMASRNLPHVPNAVGMLVVPVMFGLGVWSRIEGTGR